MHYRISFPADYAVIPAIRDMVAHTAQLEGFDQQHSDRFRSITDELCNNAIEHGSQPTSEVVLEVHSDAQAMRITCQDQGHGNKLNAEHIQKRIEGEESVQTGRGRGLKMIVNSFADKLQVKDKPNGGITVTATINKG